STIWVRSPLWLASANFRRARNVRRCRGRRSSPLSDPTIRAFPPINQVAPHTPGGWNAEAAENADGKIYKDFLCGLRALCVQAAGCRAAAVCANVDDDGSPRDR